MITEKQRLARRNNARKLIASGLSVHRGSENGRWKGGQRTKGNHPCPVCGKDRICEQRDAWRLCLKCGHIRNAINRLGMKMIGNYAKGERHYLWRGGVTLKNHKLRTNHEYRNWRRLVFQRDNYTCVACRVRNGKGKNVYLNADHIKPFSLFPELRYEVSNGRTLCKDCHSRTDTYRKSWRQLQALNIATDPTSLTFSYT